MTRLAFFAGFLLSAAVFVLAQAPTRQAQQFPQPPPARDVTVTAIHGVIDADERWIEAWHGTDNADGIVGTNDGGLLFAQEQPSRVSKLDQKDRVSVFVEQTHGAGALAFDGRGRLLAVQRTCTDPGLKTPCSEPTAIAVLYPDTQRKTLADSIDGQPLGRLNDLVVGKRGDVYFTSGGAFHLLPSGHVMRIGENLRTNGIMLSPDEKTLYVTNGGAIVAFGVQPDGAVANQHDFATLRGGAGDGMAIDAAGRVYVTSQGGVQVFGADGTWLGTIPTPRPVISVAFSGAGKQTLYVVGSGARSADGTEIATPPGVRNNAKTIYRIRMAAQGFRGRAK
jgi:gluconolactonase